ncbi:reverse transcriptase [Tanacetum coccineum]
MESQSETTQTVSALKLPVLKTREYDLWSMRMEQYLTFTDHALWEVIVNGDSVSPVYEQTVEGLGEIYEQLLRMEEKEINTGREEINTGIEEVSTGSTKVDSGTTSKRGQREGKAPMIKEDIQATHKTKEQMRQEEAGLEEAIKLQAQLDEEVAKQIYLDKMIAKRMAEEEALTEQQKKRKAQVQFEAQFYTEEDWDVIRSKLEANAELSKDMLGQDLSEQDFAKRMVDMVNQRKKHFAEEIAKAKRNKPMTQSQLKIYMSNYLKNQGTWELSQLKKLKFEEIKEEFDKYGKELQTKTSKKQKIDDKDVPAIGEKVTEVKEEEQVKRTGKRKKQKQGQRSVYQIIRANGTDTVYMSFGAMIKDFTREDLIELYRLVMQKYGTNRPEDAYDKVLWSDLRTMFDPPLIEDAIWSLPLQQKMVSNPRWLTELLVSKQTTLGDAFSLAHIREAHLGGQGVSLVNKTAIVNSGGGQNQKDNPELDNPEDQGDALESGDISILSSLVGNESPQSLQLWGTIGSGNIHVLIDNRSTHNFVQPGVVERMKLAVSITKPFKVYIGSGETLLCENICSGINMQGLAVEVDLYVLPRKGLDVVLGIQWLQKLGKVTYDYVEQTMKFILEGATHTLWDPEVKIIFFRHHLEDKVVFEGVESVTPVLQEDGRPKRPQREKSKPSKVKVKAPVDTTLAGCIGIGHHFKRVLAPSEERRED